MIKLTPLKIKLTPQAFPASCPHIQGIRLDQVKPSSPDISGHLIKPDNAPSLDISWHLIRPNKASQRRHFMVLLNVDMAASFRVRSKNSISPCSLKDYSKFRHSLTPGLSKKDDVPVDNKWHCTRFSSKVKSTRFGTEDMPNPNCFSLKTIVCLMKPEPGVLVRCTRVSRGGSQGEQQGEYDT